MTFRTATLDEVKLILAWAAEEGWNPGLDDAEAFHAADPGGFFIAVRDGAPVAAISVVNHDPRNAFLGLYLCRPDWRGKGIGFALWTHGLHHAGGRSVGLDGVAAQQQNYVKSGFRLIGATRRWEGRLAGRFDPGVRPATAEDLPALLALDAAANGYSRSSFLSAWAAPCPTRKSFVLQADGISGFATARRCLDGCKIGPVIAPDAAASLRLARAALHDLGETRAIMDLPDDNTALTADLAALDFQSSFSTARMIRGTAPRRGPELQAVATLELG